MVNTKSFIHGNAIIAERVGGESFDSSWGPLARPVAGEVWSDLVGAPAGWGKLFRGKGGNKVWFRAPIPTLTVASSSKVNLEDVFVFFSSYDTCYMEELQVWDGPQFVQEFKGLSVKGDFTRNVVSGANAFALRRTMNWGLSLGMLINFPNDSNIAFTSAGASFIHTIFE